MNDKKQIPKDWKGIERSRRKQKVIKEKVIKAKEM